MSVASRETKIYRLDSKTNHELLTPAEREKLVKPYLPDPPPGKTAARGKSSRLGVRKFLRAQLHILIFVVIHTIFSIYIRFRQAYHAVLDRLCVMVYHHHRTPELIQKDVKGLSRIPEHVSVVLALEDGGRGGAGLEILIDEVAEIAAWCACVGIPMLSVYEQTGILKAYIPAAHRAISVKLSSYFGTQQPALSIRAPHVASLESAPTTPITSRTPDPNLQPPQLSLLFLSEEDGRDSIVDLTKTLAEMAQRSKLSPADISVDLVDAELSEGVMSEPDLLILFGPRAELSGYPPWQIRLTEIYHVKDNHGVGYQVFLKALYSFANAQMRFGR